MFPLPKMGKAGWIVTGTTALLIDIIQWLIGFFEVPLSAIAIGAILVAINTGADPFIGAFALGYFELRGVNIIKYPNRLVSMLCVGGLDFLTGGIASFWVLDVWYLYRDEQKRIKMEQAAEEQEEALKVNAAIIPLYQKKNGEMMRISDAERSSAVKKPSNIIADIRPPERLDLAA